MASEYDKKILELGFALFRKKFGKYLSDDTLTAYFNSSKNVDFKDFIKNIDDVADLTVTKWQREHIRNYTKFMIWLSCNHTELRMGMEGMIKEFTKYKNFKIDLEPQVGRLDKFLIEQILKFVIKKLNERATYQRTLLESYDTSNTLAKYVMARCDYGIKDIKTEFNYKAVRSFVWLGLYIGIHDTAYRDQFYYFINKVGNNDLVLISKPFVKKPKDFYINLYDEGRKATRKKWKDGELPHHMNSIIEEPCLPVKQHRKIKKICERIDCVK